MCLGSRFGLAGCQRKVLQACKRIFAAAASMSFLRNSLPDFMTLAASSQLQRFQGTPVRQDSVWPWDPVASWVWYRPRMGNTFICRMWIVFVLPQKQSMQFSIFAQFPKPWHDMLFHCMALELIDNFVSCRLLHLKHTARFCSIFLEACKLCLAGPRPSVNTSSGLARRARAGQWSCSDGPRFCSA